jgi:hypothetical protein
MLTGCSKEGQFEVPEDNQVQEYPSTNSLVRAAKDATELHGYLANGNGEGWVEGDSVCIYTLNSLTYNTYKLKEGVGSAHAVFTRNDGTDNYDYEETLYALTSYSHIYALKATIDGNAQVSVTIPSHYNISEVGAPEGSSRMPVPYWGTANFGSDGKLEANFRGMTALLKIDITTLPENTYAVVLTTHYSGSVSDQPLDGGDRKPLSGTFDTVLKEGAKLASKPIFNSFDTLRVNLDKDYDTQYEQEYRYIFIPVLAATYANLHVIAVTGDRSNYQWEGKVLKTFKSNTIFEPNTIVKVESDPTGIRPPKVHT